MNEIQRYRYMGANDFASYVHVERIEMVLSAKDDAISSVEDALEVFCCCEAVLAGLSLKTWSKDIQTEMVASANGKKKTALQYLSRNGMLIHQTFGKLSWQSQRKLLSLIDTKHIDKSWDIGIMEYLIDEMPQL